MGNQSGQRGMTEAELGNELRKGGTGEGEIFRGRVGVKGGGKA